VQKKKGYELRSPLTRELLVSTTVIPNIAMKRAIRDALDAAVREASSAADHKHKRVVLVD
jgi:hypothetical protein